MNKMKYLIINGSPRKKNTWKIVQQAKKNIDGEFEEIHLTKQNIPLCNGCFRCIVEGEDKCPHFDLIQPIVEKIHEADGLIIASPVYAMNVTALLKNFLDHTAYFYHRPDFFTKKALVIVTTAGAGHKKVANYISETLHHWGVNKVYKFSIACGGKESFETKKIDSISQKFSDDVTSKRFDSPKLSDIIFFDVWKAMMSTDNAIEVDRQFWINNNLISNDYSPEVKLGFFKTIFSKIMFNILKIVMK